MNSEICNKNGTPILTEMTPVNVDEYVIKDNCENPIKDKKDKPTITKEKLKEAIIYCEWNMCCVFLSLGEMKKFLLHVTDHITAANEPPTSEGYLCLWRSCGFACHSKDERDRHIYFHAYHSKLKGIGEVVMKQFNLQCLIGDQTKNLLPEMPDPLVCMWNDCGFNFVSAQEFFWHAEAHPNSVCREKWKKGKQMYFLCSWKDCETMTKASYRLIDHVRTHTQEKVVACPNCGSIFASFPGFRDHCFRHVAEKRLKFECSHCKSKFATERLLREHVRSHVNHFKCPHCEMTCPSKTSMENHIIYRHTNNKPFKCPECEKRFKFHLDIIKHLPSHSVEPSFACPFPDCEFSSRSYSTYNLHLKKKHTEVDAPKNPYMCHICERKFGKGTKLTSHLKKGHDFHWPAGHTRFRYSRDDDGYYRLQTTRIESIELAQEMLSGDCESNVDNAESQEPGTPFSEDSMTPYSQEYMTPNSQEYMTPNSQEYMTPNSQEYMTPNSQDSMTPYSLESMKPCSQPATHFSQKVIEPCSQELVTPNSLGSVTSQSQIMYNKKSSEKLYLCHICETRFHKGSKLTDHFEKIHKFHWLLSHTRFRYGKADDGLFKLQTILFESPKLTQENLKVDLKCDNNNMVSTRRGSTLLAPSSLNEVANSMKCSGTREHLYKCHLCRSKFLKGPSLTEHLKMNHNFPFSADSTRFRYSKHIDGLLKLRSIRFEHPLYIMHEVPENLEDDSDTKLPSTNINSTKFSTSDVIEENVNKSTLEHSATPEKVYKCLICQVRFSNASTLTDHLKKVHDYHWSAGHTRYKQNQNDGEYYEIKTTQLESFEFTQAMLDKEHITEDHTTLLPMTPGAPFDIPGLHSTDSNNEQCSEQENLYMCHICERKFSREDKLTDHFKSNHSHRWPSGNIRIVYCQDYDGYFRLRFKDANDDDVENEISDRNNDYSYNDSQLPMTPDVIFSTPGLLMEEPNAVEEQLMIGRRPFKKRKTEKSVLPFSDL